MSVRGRLGSVLVALGLVAAFPSTPTAQSLQLQLESGEAYADMPFVLVAVADGFDEEPTPEPPDLTVEGCEVTYLGMRPEVSQGVQIVNGRRSDWRRVKFTYRWRIEAPKSGRFTVPGLTLEQGSKRAVSRPATLDVKSIEATRDMRLELNIPQRTVWVGETFEVTIDWLLRRDVSDYTFSVPLFNLDFIQVQPGENQGRRTVSFPAGSMDVELPYTQTRVSEGGETYNRFRFHARVTAQRPGTLDVAPIKVAAQLQSGAGRDAFGFRVPRYRLFKAESERGRMTVRPLPQQGRPPTFENAIGTAFSLNVQASRTVVSVGDPVELKVRVRGNGPLEGLSLPRWTGEGGLPPELFSVPDVPGVGEIDPQGGVKTFDLTVRVRSAEVREIPPLEFSYFDPEAGEYRTIHSEPIALSVAGSNVVGADQVDAAVSADASTAVEGSGASANGSRPGAGLGPATLIGADLSLSTPGHALGSAWALGDVLPWIAGLYLVPVFVLVGRIWQVRTRDRRDRDGDVRQALTRLERALDDATPARDATPAVVSAVRSLARLTGHEKSLGAEVLERLETRAFDPQEGNRPIPKELAEEVRSLAREWADTSRPDSATRGAMLLLLVACGATPLALAQAVPPTEAQALTRAREVYQAALEEPDRVRRTRLFGEASLLLGELVRTHCASPDLLTDWGNASLGAQDLGHAALAYRRALQLDPNHERARKNLGWLRGRSPAWLPRPAGAGALDSLVFWHHRLSVAERHLIGAAAFGFGLLLLAPWSTRRVRLLRRLAVVAFLIWIGATGSALLDSDDARGAVLIQDGTILRSADNLGAPPVLSTPLPAGAELEILEQRPGWSRVALADGTRGWIHASAAEAVVPPRG